MRDQHRTHAQRVGRGLTQTSLLLPRVTSAQVFFLHPVSCPAATAPSLLSPGRIPPPPPPAATACSRRPQPAPLLCFLGAPSSSNRRLRRSSAAPDHLSNLLRTSSPTPVSTLQSCTRNPKSTLASTPHPQP
jgi:hypothetical protein